MKQLYHFRVVRPSEKNMNRDQQEQFMNFISEPKHKHFLHFMSQNNVTPEARINEIEPHKSLFNDTQTNTFQKIKTLLKETPGKLKCHFHWALIKLQQFISGMRLKDTVKQAKSNQEGNNPPSQVTNRNKNEVSSKEPKKSQLHVWRLQKM